jgi:hypothetical protein
LPAAAGPGAADSLTIGPWTIGLDSNKNLIFKFDGKVQAMLRSPSKPSCPGTKLAKWCVE